MHIVKKRGPPKGYVEELERKVLEVEALLHELSKNKKRPIHEPHPQLYKELDSLHSRPWPPGTSYDNIYYLGDLESLQFFSHKIDLTKDRKWKGHYIRKFGDKVVLVADDKPSTQNKSKIPHFQWMDMTRQIKGIHQYIYSVTGVDQYTSTRLLKIYFANVHPILPVINKVEFLKQYRDLINTYPSGELLNAMFGAAARFVECESLQPERKHHLPPDAVWDLPVGWSDHFFDQAQFIISKWTANPTISKVQAIVLVHNHRGNLDSKSSACWLVGGFAMRLAHIIGLHRSCDDWDIAQSEKETRKRLWWALYIADRFQSALRGRPMSIKDEDNDVGYPDPTASWQEVLDGPIDESDTNLIRFPSASSPPDDIRGSVEIYQLFIQFAKLAEILGRILQGLYTPKAQEHSYEYGSDRLVAALDHELTEWRTAFPQVLHQTKLKDYEEKTGYFAPVIASTRLFYYSALILLHRPFIKANHASGRPLHSSFQICTSAAIRGLQIAEKMTIQDFLMCPYSFSLYPVMQCCLIHMHNTTNPDKNVSQTAKLYLQKGISLVDRVHAMSSTAQKLKVLLHNIMKNKHIDLERLSGRKESPVTGTTSKISDIRQDRSIDHTAKKRSQEEVNSVHVEWPVTASVVQRPFDTISVMRSGEEAFSLKQFGFEAPKYNVTTQDTAPWLMDWNQPMPLTALSNGAIIFDDETLQQPDKITQSSAIPPQITDECLAHPTNQIFRNEPDNPFWGIPASMDWEAWNAWYQSTLASGTWQPLC
ncbi:Transcriptional activator of fatty acid utilization [Apophysomyces ossiformis]|uniref:Transcriptional activator of fatty acid utilization n=1 Tax=Apophysomyces ossiformis TaxID=679940 RepID=A0A8H7BV32_9FUNG|nr:Transcriptional activator of fatty acid utilization [Apophysomyces ossiformis]